MRENLYGREPLSCEKNIPIFSNSDEYIDNYEKIAQDHLDSERKHGVNPFIPEELWLDLEDSTLQLIKKHTKSGDKILDVGVGTGRILSQISGLERFGMDISLDYLQVAQSKGIEVCFSLIEDMPYQRNFFDVAICTDVLEHVLDLNLACSKILSVLKPGGVLIVRVPYKENLSANLDPNCPYKYVHLRNFDEYSLRLLLERIFGCKFVEWTAAGFDGSGLRAKCTTAISLLRYPWLKPVLLFSKRIFMSILNLPFLQKDLRPTLLRKICNPAEINMVVIKQETYQ